MKSLKDIGQIIKHTGQIIKHSAKYLILTAAFSAVVLACQDIYPPVTKFDADHTSGVVPLIVNFDGGNSYDVASPTGMGGVITDSRWDYTYNPGEGPQTDGTGLTGRHTYPDIGTFTARLTNRDAAGNPSFADVIIHVLAEPDEIPPYVLESTIGLEPNDPDQHRNDLEALVTPNENVKEGKLYVDGVLRDTFTSNEGSTEVTLDYSNLGLGSHDIAVILTDMSNNESELYSLGSITIGEAPDLEAPVARITIDRNELYLPGTVNPSAVTSTDNRGIVTYEWDLNNDGTTDATGVTASKAYTDSDAGYHTIKLTVTDAAGRTDSATLEIIAAKDIPPPLPYTPYGAVQGANVNEGDLVEYFVGGRRYASSNVQTETLDDVSQLVYFKHISADDPNTAIMEGVAHAGGQPVTIRINGTDYSPVIGSSPLWSTGVTERKDMQPAL